MHRNHIAGLFFNVSKIIFIFFLWFLEPACKKFVEIPPPTGQLVNQTIFTSDATATSAILGIYSRMISSTGFASGSVASIPVLTGLSSDELDNFSVDPSQVEFYTNALSINNSLLQSSLWAEPYQYIYTANSCIEGISSSNSLSSPVKNELLGEAKFIRSFCNFYLVNLFDEIPLLTQSSYNVNALSKRDSVADIFNQIIADLKDAENLLVDDYSFGNGERIRPNKSAAEALLARVYLYMGEWSQAEQYATIVINKSDIFSLEPNLDSAFLSGSREAIWQLKPNQPGYNSNEANTFIFLTPPVGVALSQTLLNAFETGDNRRTHWIDSLVSSGIIYYYPYKYKITSQVGSTTISEYSIVLRLAEQYLIRSEARAEIDNYLGSASDLNMIRLRAGLSNTTAATKTDLLSAIAQERRIELFTEWGHRWLDLKRTQAVDSVMASVTPLKGGSWNSNQQLYPIPQTDRQADPNLSQNPGY